MSGGTVRQAVLDQVAARQQSTEGGGRMKGKVGIITGVGPVMGIGSATARLCAREGASHLYLLDYAEKHFAALLKTLKTAFPRTQYTAVKGDVSSPSDVKGLVDRAIKEEGHLDFFFANAGVIGERIEVDASGRPTKLGPSSQVVTRLPELAEEDFMATMKVNALGPFIALKYAGPAMDVVCPSKGKAVPGGSIVLTASVAGIRAGGGPIIYSASKAAVISLAQTSAMEFTGRNIRVNAICPGLIQTDMTKLQFDSAIASGKIDRMGTLNPALRQGLGSDVGQLALFLASDESSYVNGQAIAVDGGLTASVPFIRLRSAKL